MNLETLANTFDKKSFFPDLKYLFFLVFLLILQKYIHLFYQLFLCLFYHLNITRHIHQKIQEISSNYTYF